MGRAVEPVREDRGEVEWTRLVLEYRLYLHNAELRPEGELVLHDERATPVQDRDEIRAAIAVLSDDEAAAVSERLHRSLRPCLKRAEAR